MFHYFSFFFRVVLYFCYVDLFFPFFFSIFHYFSLPQQRVRMFHVNHRRGGVVLSRFWHSLTWNRFTIWAPKQHLFFSDLGLLHFLEMLLNQWFWWLPFVDSKNASNEQFKIKKITGKHFSSSPNSGLSRWTPRSPPVVNMEHKNPLVGPSPRGGRVVPILAFVNLE